LALRRKVEYDKLRNNIMMGYMETSEKIVWKVQTRRFL
jgi:uncharacterized protein with HEPN domain